MRTARPLSTSWPPWFRPDKLPKTPGIIEALTAHLGQATAAPLSFRKGERFRRRRLPDSRSGRLAR